MIGGDHRVVPGRWGARFRFVRTREDRRLQMEREWQEAALQGDATTLARLVATGADVDSLDRHGQTALMLAARDGHTGAVRILVEAGAALDHTAKYHLSALMLAVINDRHTIVELLVAAGADPRIRGTGAPGFAGKTALDLAEDLGRTDIAAMLRAGQSPGR